MSPKFIKSVTALRKQRGLPTIPAKPTETDAEKDDSNTNDKESQAIPSEEEQNGNPAHISDQEIIERLSFAMSNEAIRALGDNAAQRPGDIDLISVWGCGYPAHEGGPIFYADEVGAEYVLEKLEGHHEEYLEAQKKTSKSSLR